ncbi:Ig-like domain-containing protein [Parahaliea sp. F7430]|uniref:Ig-like domain-containing protein n=1 Tax=Sediminihaliea albiluteola TaxID=2758564 RepID=A0A7W2TVQ1_9GAMM|nr:Ig-like domain-containing protein [Sediminihaliea albiluteola]MBA6412824.1 Ig-like domain-containing protein [Sediminihaliea albiluteola]
MITRFATLTNRLTALIATLFIVTACGGGGGGSDGGGFIGGGGDGSNAAPYFLTLELLDATGEPTSTVTTTKPATLSVRVTNKGPNGKAIPDVVVSAATDLGNVAPATALSDANGFATFTLEAGATLGAGSVTVSVTNTDNVPTEAAINYQVDTAGLRLGHFKDGVFIENEIGINPESSLVYQGAAELSLAIVDEDGSPVTTEETVTFNSTCLAKSDASLDPSAPISTTTGYIRTTYKASRCSGDDEITARIMDGDGVAFGTLNIASPRANSLLFVSAEPELIVLKGTGGGNERPESSLVTFQVINSNNNPLPNVKVDFSLTTSIGGLSLTPSSAISDSDGLVKVTLFSGDVSTVVRVIASVNAGDGSGTSLSTVSNILTVSTGLPDQNSISLSVQDGFVVENGLTVDGVERCITVRMADKFNNPVIDGTSAIFTTEYGTIDPSCSTGTRNGERAGSCGGPNPGSCSVLWTSGEPRFPTLSSSLNSIRRINDPNGYSCKSHNGRTGPCPDDLGPVRGGRSTILVTAIGEESFVDRNGNGIMDEAERDLFENLPEAFIDHNEDGIFNPAEPFCANNPQALACISGNEETFVDFNNDQKYNKNNNPALYNGLLCPREGDGIWCSRELVNVRAQTYLILSGGDSYGWDFLLTRGRSVMQGTQEGSQYMVYVSDAFNNKPPAGSTITISTSGGCEIISPTQFTVPSTASYGAFGFPLETGGNGERGNVIITLNPKDGAPYTESFGCQSNAPPTDSDLTTSPGG